MAQQQNTTKPWGREVIRILGEFLVVCLIPIAFATVVVTGVGCRVEGRISSEAPASGTVELPVPDRFLFQDIPNQSRYYTLVVTDSKHNREFLVVSSGNGTSIEYLGPATNPQVLYAEASTTRDVDKP